MRLGSGAQIKAKGRGKSGWQSVKCHNGISSHSCSSSCYRISLSSLSALLVVLRNDVHHRWSGACSQTLAWLEDGKAYIEEQERTGEGWCNDQRQTRTCGQRVEAWCHYEVGYHSQVGASTNRTAPIRPRVIVSLIITHQYLNTPHDVSKPSSSPVARERAASGSSSQALTKCAAG